SPTYQADPDVARLPRYGVGTQITRCGHTMPVPNGTSISSGLPGAALSMEFIALIAGADGSLRGRGVRTVVKARFTPALRPPPGAAAAVSRRAWLPGTGPPRRPRATRRR